MIITLNDQEIMLLIRKCYENRGYNVGKIAMEWSSQDEYCKLNLEIKEPEIKERRDETDGIPIFYSRQQI